MVEILLAEAVALEKVPAVLVELLRYQLRKMGLAVEDF
jgi:hypothetical protein